MFIQSGNKFGFGESHVQSHPKLPAGNYVMKCSPESIWLEQADSYGDLGKVYGSTMARVARIMTTYQDRNKSTGVLLAGPKGSGKTMLAKLVSITAGKMGIPTIIVNTYVPCNMMGQFLQSFDQQVVIMLDEFDKTYAGKAENDDEGNSVPSQHGLLTILDGVFPNRALFVMTCNEIDKIDDHFINRPGRLYYAIEFGGLEPDAIRQYCKDNLKNQSQTEPIVRLSHLFKDFSFDQLKAMVQEMNRYNEDAVDAIKLLNVKPDPDYRKDYDIELCVGGQAWPAHNPQETWSGRILQAPSITIKVLDYERGPDGEMIPCHDEYAGAGPGSKPVPTYKLKHGGYVILDTVTFTQKDLVSEDHEKGQFYFKKGKYELTLTKKHAFEYDYGSYMGRGM